MRAFNMKSSSHYPIRDLAVVDRMWLGGSSVSSQGTTREELIENLCSALHEAFEMNRADALAAESGAVSEITDPVAWQRDLRQDRPLSSQAE